ncbi:MAG: hypothetical protein ACOX2M_04285 [Fastidiosipilaceae bacterium]|jgi:hypothetical protein
MKEIDRQQKDTTPLVSRHTDVTEARATETKSARVFTRRAASERTAEEKGHERLGSIRASAADEEAELHGFTIPKPPRKTLAQRLNRQGKAKIYRLKGYTSVARVNRKQRRDREHHRVVTVRIVLSLIALLLIAILIWNPFSTLREFFHALGF